jgi:histidinol-phosphatase (PHP family)
VPVALSSDAHSPVEVGHGYEQVVEQLQEWGVEQLSVFERRVRRLEPIGPEAGEPSAR